MSAKLNILRHSLGLKDDGKGRPYRNYFVTGEGCTDYPLCMALVSEGLMTRRAGYELSGGYDVFCVTEAGRAAALSKAMPTPRETKL